MFDHVTSLCEHVCVWLCGNVCFYLCVRVCIYVCLVGMWLPMCVCVCIPLSSIWDERWPVRREDGLLLVRGLPRAAL